MANHTSSSVVVWSDPSGPDGAAGARLHAYADLILGVSDVVQRVRTSCPQGTSGDELTVVNSNVTEWAPKLDPSVMRLTALAQSTSATVWLLPTHVHAANVGAPGSLLASISTPDLLVALFSPVDPASGLINETVSPPMIMVLDSRMKCI